MTVEEFKSTLFHANMKIELNNGEIYQLLQVDFNNEIISFRANDGYITHATINYVKRVFDA